MNTHSRIKIRLPQIGGAGGSRSPSSPARSASSCCFLLCSSRSFLRNSSCCRRALSRATCNWSCCFLSSSSRRCSSSSSLCFLRLRKQPRDGQGNGRQHWDILVRRTHGQCPGGGGLCGYGPRGHATQRTLGVQGKLSKEQKQEGSWPGARSRSFLAQLCALGQGHYIPQASFSTVRR